MRADAADVADTILRFDPGGAVLRIRDVARVVDVEEAEYTGEKKSVVTLWPSRASTRAPSMSEGDAGSRSMSTK